MDRQQVYDKIINHLRPYHPTRIGIFGSFARNTHSPNSDIDILVDFKETVNLLDLIGIEMELSELLGTKVDLVTERALYPSLKSLIEKDLTIILDEQGGD